MTIEKSESAVQRADGFFYIKYNDVDVRVCEDCWKPIPRYVDFPQGLTSPESDGDQGGNFAKTRSTSVEGKEGKEAMRKAVCLPCYNKAFKRVHPNAPLPKLSGVLINGQESYAPDFVPPVQFVGEPKGA